MKPGSLLEIEVGGTIFNPPTVIQHDQVQVSGITTLGGTVEFPILPGDIPQANDEITFLTSGSIDGNPSGTRRGTQSDECP